MENKCKNLLIQPVYDLLKDPDHWTKAFYAVDDNGNNIGVDDEHACKWCLVGALMKVNRMKIGTLEKLISPVLTKKIINSKSYSDIVAFNDAPETKHQDVLALLVSIP